mmetsp:Transcript_28461/g.63541  ORF Transcript_28461/g.63541 Transcript_28461/m.63541 type:complete len:516 (-) Transcript_28461:74-1621(-)
MSDLSEAKVAEVFARFDADHSGDLDTFELSSAIEGLFGSPPGTKQIMAIVAAAGTTTNTLDMAQFKDLARKFGKGHFDRVSDEIGADQYFYEHSFGKPSLGFGVRNIPELGTIVVSKISDPDLVGAIEIGDTVIAVNGAPLGWIKETRVLGDKVKPLRRPVRITFATTDARSVSEADNTSSKQGGTRQHRPGVNPESSHAEAGAARAYSSPGGSRQRMPGAPSSSPFGSPARSRAAKNARRLSLIKEGVSEAQQAQIYRYARKLFLTGQVKEAAELGLPRAQGKLAQRHYYGRGIEQDYGKCFEWASKAAEGGDLLGLLHMGHAFHYGRGAELNPKVAIEWYTKAWAKGDAGAMNQIGGIYFHGSPRVPQNHTKAADRFRLAAEVGHPTAQSNLAMCLYEGLGSPMDLSAAREWFLKAADGGHAPAQFKAGYMLARGEGGPSDMSGGVALIDKAAKAGNSNAKKFKKELQSLFLNQDFAVGFGYADGRIDAPGAPHSSAASVGSSSQCLPGSPRH